MFCISEMCEMFWVNLTQKKKPMGILADRYCYGCKKQDLLFILWEFELLNQSSAFIFEENAFVLFVTEDTFASGGPFQMTLKGFSYPVFCLMVSCVF